ncbi:RNA-directed DNA polymerase, eukaryota, reverse transcriptase zinc-binding domain protein [Tanacetum coccineum]
MVSWIMTCVVLTKFSINVNGERVGYFKGGRGLRQRDPISPYLFTLVMEVLNLLVQKNIKESKVFKYHFGCKNLKITHLCFADDLLVFCHGDPESVKVIKKSFDEFSGYSGLLPNLQKRRIFFRGLSSDEQQSIINIIPFSVGKLLVRYLGVPLLTKKLSISDCKPIISKVKTKISDWKNKALSYAGRVIYEINKLLKGFLWCQGELTKGKAKVSWDKIFKPKDQGGLGLKNLGVWNKVLMIKHLWNVAMKKDTLVKWIYMKKLKGRSIWEAQCDDKSTMGWKNILSLRDKVRKHIGWKLGNGKSVNIWYDKWCSVSPLSDFIDTRDIYDARLNNNCTLQVPILSDDIKDTAVWILENGNKKKFKISNVWKDMNCQEEKVDWHLLVWFAQSIPRHAFVTWLAIHERLMTHKLLNVYGNNIKVGDHIHFRLLRLVLRMTLM